MDCVVRSVSDTGAGLELDGVNVVIPNAFVLEFDGVAHDCVIAWRSERRIGVAFTMRSPLAADQLQKASEISADDPLLIGGAKRRRS